MELVLLLLFLSLPFRCFFPSNLYRPAPPRSRNRTVLRRINFYKEELYNRGKAEGRERKERFGQFGGPEFISISIAREKGKILRRRGEKSRKKEFERDLFFRSASLHSSRFFPTANVWGRKNGWNWYAWRILGQAQCPSLHPRENLSFRDLAGCKTSRRLSLNPATSTREAKERKRGGGSFLFCRNYFPGRASCLIFPRRHLPAFSPRHLASAASDVFGKLVQFPAASMTRLVSETLRGRRAQECFLPSASCRLSSHLSLSLSLSPFFEREERWMLASFFFSLLLLISNASR